MNRKSRSITRRSSILKIDVNRDDDTGIIGGRNRRSSRRVSFAEMCQIKEFQRDSPKVFKDLHKDDNNDDDHTNNSTNNHSITGLDKLLTGAIQTPYQDVAEYPIPEMSAESFNIFDFNKTVLDHVDMDTTEASGGIDSFFPQMNFQNEPSMELKFDTKSFLQSLQGNSSHSLKTMQIYSPKRDRYMQEQTSPDNQTLPMHINNMGPDKENMVPMEFRNSDGISPQSWKYFTDEEPQGSIDSRTFLQSLFGEKPKKLEETKHDIEEMEETACIDGILKEVNGGHNINRSSGSFTVVENANVTKYFNAEDVTVGIEESKCVGGIISEAFASHQNIVSDKENLPHFLNQTVHMEETRPIGGILKGGSDTTQQSGLRMKEGFNISINSDVTRCFKMEEDADDGIEETKCVGGILSKGDENTAVEKMKTYNSLEAAKVVDIANISPATINFNVNDIQDNMEETKAIGGIIDRTYNEITRGPVMDSDSERKLKTVNHTVIMEKTMSSGKNVETPRTSDLDLSLKKPNIPFGQIMCSIDADTENKPENTCKSLYGEDKLSSMHEEDMEITKNITVPMKETKAIGGFLDKINLECKPDTPKDNSDIDKTAYVSVAMEETKALGGLLDKTAVNVDSYRFQSHDLFDKTVDCTVAMEETKALGGFLNKTTINLVSDKLACNDIVDKTIDYTVAMEETKAIDGILDKTKKDVLKKDHSRKNDCSDKTLNQTAPIEKTMMVGGIFNKTSDQTTYFDDVKTDWISNDLKARSSEGKAADGTTIESTNNSTAVEETRCVGGILSNDMEMMKGKFENMYNHANDEDRGNKTSVEPVQMEETRCVNNVVDKVTDQVNSYMGNSKTSVSTEKGVDGKNNESSASKDVQENELEVDDEITFKVSNKRNYEECHGDSLDKNEEKTKDYTQTQTNLTKLKEMLILSKRKTAAHLRQGDIRTPSKFSPLFPGSAPQSTSKSSCNSQLDLNVTRSPVHKRQRLSEGGPEVDKGSNDEFGVEEKTDATAALLGGFEDDVFTTGLREHSKLENTDIQGIDDELMPDILHHEVLNSSNETHSDKDSTTRSDPVSTPMYENNETQSSGNDTRSSTSANLSMISNKSFALSFVVPEGPMTLESFFRLTFTLTSKIQGTRCSTIFAPRLDLDDMTEVLNAELTLKPLVKAKKKMKAYFTQLIEKSEANLEWLEKSLEETQPEIFQICSKASSDELRKINCQLRSLVSACHNEADIAWKQKLKEIFSEAVEEIQVEGVKRAEEMLEKNKADNQALDNLLISIDNNLENLDRNEKELDDLQLTEEKLRKEMEKLSVCIKEKTVEEMELLSQLKSQSKKEETFELRNRMKEELVSHLICCEYNLGEFEQDMAVFTFLDEKVELCVNFVLGAEEKQISNVTLKINSSTNGPMYLQDEVACVFALNGINVNSLRQRFTTFSSLPKLIHEVSVSINEIKMFCKDLEEVNMSNVIKFEDRSISTELWNRKTMDFIKVSFLFDPTHPLTNHAETSVHVKIGNLKSKFIEDKLREVIPRPRYLSSLVNSVNFEQLKIDPCPES